MTFDPFKVNLMLITEIQKFFPEVYILRLFLFWRRHPFVCQRRARPFSTAFTRQPNAVNAPLTCYLRTALRAAQP